MEGPQWSRKISGGPGTGLWRMNWSLPGSPRQSAGDLLGRGLCCLRLVPLFVSLLSKPLPNPFLWCAVRSALASQVEARCGWC